MSHDHSWDDEPYYVYGGAKWYKCSSCGMQKRLHNWCDDSPQFYDQDGFPCLDRPCRDEERESEGAILDIWAKLGEHERSVLLTIAKRLRTGQEQYGKLSKGKKNWRKEASEEAFDMAVYLSALLTLEDE